LIRRRSLDATVVQPARTKSARTKPRPPQRLQDRRTDADRRSNPVGHKPAHEIIRPAGAKLPRAHGDIVYGAPPVVMPINDKAGWDGWYVSAARRFRGIFEAGAYYGNLHQATAVQL